jgi:hypothetical protein
LASDDYLVGHSEAFDITTPSGEEYALSRQQACALAACLLWELGRDDASAIIVDWEVAIKDDE